jgi:hypothetical protein
MTTDRWDHGGGAESAIVGGQPQGVTGCRYIVAVADDADGDQLPPFVTALGITDVTSAHERAKAAGQLLIDAIDTVLSAQEKYHRHHRLDGPVHKLDSGVRAVDIERPRPGAVAGNSSEYVSGGGSSSSALDLAFVQDPIIQIVTASVVSPRCARGRH